MIIHNLIFSKQRSVRILRHVGFWVIFSIGFYVQSIVPAPRPFLSAFISLCCFLPACMLSVYICLRVLLPLFLEKRKYGKFLLGFIFLGLGGLFWNNCMAILFYILNLAPDTPLLEKAGLALINTHHALMIGGLALGFKFGKNWYSQQKQNQALAKQKIAHELQLEKARLHPAFLFRTLDRLKGEINAGSIDASEMVLRLSEILSYILYDSAEKTIALERELTMIENLVHIEQMNHDHGTHVDFKVNGSSHDYQIVPSLLFPLLHGYFQWIQNSAYKGIRSSIICEIKDKKLRFALAVQHRVAANLQPVPSQGMLKKALAKLVEVYPNDHPFEIIQEQQETIISIGIPLENIPEPTTPIQQKREVYEST